MKKNTLTRIFAIAAAGAGLAGCATVQNPDPRDPWEGFNRGVYTFNDKVDRAVLRPIAVGYTKVTPQPVQSCIHNIFNNVADIWAAANSMLQGRGVDAINTFGRFLFNTTMGVGGCFDVATANGANRIPNDFGTTLGVWGVGQGPYLVLPFWGSSTIRDTAGLAGDFVGNQWTSVGAIENVPVRNSLYGLWVVDRRASLLDATDTVDRVALDPYSFVRDAYLQRRAAMVLGRKAGDASNLPDYDDDSDENGNGAASGKPAGAGGATGATGAGASPAAPAGPGIGGAGAGSAPAGSKAPARQ
ncbi:VacJ family lipoprotein [Bordetella bronchialis]|uniref:MlaA family lipoprotein n=1 Tax=Bordetella bronchialis TaxID=463025 RepID=UPI0009F49BCD|nr:VacJ family lipoprotein [Bordetella bronchialis]